MRVLFEVLIWLKCHVKQCSEESHESTCGVNVVVRLDDGEEVLFRPKWDLHHNGRFSPSHRKTVYDSVVYPYMGIICMYPYMGSYVYNHIWVQTYDHVSDACMGRQTHVSLLRS